MKKHLFSQFLAIVFCGIIFQSCQVDETSIINQPIDEGIIKTSSYLNNLKSVGCIDPTNPIYTKVTAEQTIEWGNKHNPFTKTVSIVFYNTETHFIIEVMSTNGWSNLIIDGATAWNKGPVAENIWGVFQTELPLNWSAGDAMNFNLKVVGHGPQAKFEINYELIGLCSTNFGTMTDIEGNVYETVEIGELEWMRENLGTMTFNNGELIPTGFSAEEWINYSGTGPAVEIFWAIEFGPIDYEAREKIHEDYGALYNFMAASDPRGLCPTGWRVATKQDWQQLLSYVENINNFEVGNQLKSCRQQNSPLGGECATMEDPYWEDYDQTNYGLDLYGFSAIPGGHRNQIGGFGNIRVEAHYWTSTPDLYAPPDYPNGAGFAFGMRTNQSDVYMFGEVIERAHSVRCVRDKN